MATEKMESCCVTLNGRKRLARQFDRVFRMVVFGAGALTGMACLSAETLPAALQRAQQSYAAAHSNYLASPGVTEVAARLGRVCFELADISTNNQSRAEVAEEGIGAARFASQMDPKNAESFLFLALNQGELAQTKTLGALSLLRQMEKSLVRAAELNLHLEHAGPDRSLGLLYRDAPGWPVSVGSTRKAREHLERSINLEPDYPDNYLSLMEGYLLWKEKDLLQQQMARYRKLLPDAQKKYAGVEWEQAWHDWAERWDGIQAKFQSL